MLHGGYLGRIRNAAIRRGQGVTEQTENGSASDTGVVGETIVGGNPWNVEG